MSTSPQFVLLAEDDETDVFLMQRAFASAGFSSPLQIARDGQEVVDRLTDWHRQRQAPHPGLVMLDLRMPGRDGLQTLQWIREQPWLTGLPVFVFSSSSHHRDVEQAYRLGASGFLIKPPSTAERADLVRFITDWLRLNQTPWHTRSM